MNTASEGVDLGFTKERFPECHHLCLIYDNDEQRQKIVSEYLVTGVKQGDLVRYFSDTTSTEEVRTWLSETGIEHPKSRGRWIFRCLQS
jgi:hypothetical protein